MILKKSEAEYFSFPHGGTMIENVTWSYPKLFPKAIPIADHTCFIKGHSNSAYVYGMR